MNSRNHTSNVHEDIDDMKNTSKFPSTYMLQEYLIEEPLYFLFIYLKQQYRNCFLHSMNQTYRNCFSRWVLPQQQNSSYLCRVIFKEPVQPLILFWASRWVIPCALIPSMLRTTSPILTCACDALPPSFSCNK